MRARSSGLSGLVVFIGFMTLAACGAPAPAAAPSAANATAASAAVATAPSSTPDPAVAKKAGARIAGVEASKESATDKRVRLVFENPTTKPCQIRGYTLRWGKVSKAVKLDGLTIPAGETRERSLKVHPDDGDLEALTEAGATIEVDAVCE